MLNTGDVANDNVKMTLALTLGMMINTRCATEAGCQAQVRATLVSYTHILVVTCKRGPFLPMTVILSNCGHPNPQN